MWLLCALVSLKTELKLPVRVRNLEFVEFDILYVNKIKDEHTSKEHQNENEITANSIEWNSSKRGT